jgi:hypothetical protein
VSRTVCYQRAKHGGDGDVLPGACSAQAGMSLTGPVAVCAKVTEGTEYSASPY